MIRIALVDDKSYGLEQIQERHFGEEFSLKYFPTFQEFKKSKQYFDMVYLDYYLDKDGITADRILDQVQQQTKKIIAFSSVERCNRELQRLGADTMILKI